MVEVDDAIPSHLQIYFTEGVYSYKDIRKALFEEKSRLVDKAKEEIGLFFDKIFSNLDSKMYTEIVEMEDGSYTFKKRSEEGLIHDAKQHLDTLLRKEYYRKALSELQR